MIAYVKMRRRYMYAMDMYMGKKKDSTKEAATSDDSFDSFSSELEMEMIADYECRKAKDERILSIMDLFRIKAID